MGKDGRRWRSPPLKDVMALLLFLCTPAEAYYNNYGEAPPSPEPHREYRVDYVPRPPNNPPSYVVPDQVKTPAQFKPHQGKPIYYQSDTTTTTTSYYAPYVAPTMRPLLSITYHPPPMSTTARDHTEKVVQGLPHAGVAKSYDVGLVSYRHPFPVHTTRYPVTSAPYSTKYKGEAYTTTYSTTTTTYEQPPRPEYHVPVRDLNSTGLLLCQIDSTFSTYY